MKIKLFFNLVFLLIFSLSFSQSDEDFEYAAKDVNGSEYYVYIEKVNYSTKDVWIKVTKPLKTIKNKKGKYVKTGGGYTLTFMTINCDERKFDIMESHTYDKNGNVISNDDFPSYNNKVVPGSVMSGVFSFTCTD